jgi:transcription antitermination factor NusG
MKMEDLRGTNGPKEIVRETEFEVGSEVRIAGRYRGRIGVVTALYQEKSGLVANVRTFAGFLTKVSVTNLERLEL